MGPLAGERGRAMGSAEMEAGSVLVMEAEACLAGVVALEAAREVKAETVGVLVKAVVGEGPEATAAQAVARARAAVVA